MTLIQSWKDSFKLLLPANLKLFVLVTFKSIIECYKILFRHWWWVISIVIGVTIFDWYFDIYRIGDILAVIFAYAIPLIFTFFIYVTILSIRSLIVQKSTNSFMKDLKYFVLLLFIMLLFHFLIVFYAFSASKYFMMHFIFRVILFGFTSLENLFPFFPILVLFMLFFLDSDRGLLQLIVSFYYSIKMILFKAPIFLFFGVLMFLMRIINLPVENIMIDQKLYSGYIRVWSLIELLIFVPIFICIYTNIYIKKEHK